MSPQSLFEYERHAELLSVGLLLAGGAGTSAEIRARLTDGDFPEDAAGRELPRIAVTAAPFAKASEQMGLSRQGIPFHNHVRGQVVFEITAARRDAARHRAWIGLIRRVTSPASGILERNFGPYQLLEFAEAPGSVVLLKEGERDRSLLPFNVQLVIPSGLLDYSETEPVPAPATPA